MNRNSVCIGEVKVPATKKHTQSSTEQ